MTGMDLFTQALIWGVFVLSMIAIFQNFKADINNKKIVTIYQKLTHKGAEKLNQFTLKHRNPNTPCVEPIKYNSKKMLEDIANGFIEMPAKYTQSGRAERLYLDAEDIVR